MSQHPLNLGVRFVLEVGALAAIATWGWTQHAGWLRLALAVGLPLVAAGLWGTFAVPGDRSRSGGAPVPMSGLVRLLLELALFGFAVWALFEAQQIVLGWVMALVTLVHYAVSYDRIVWLIKQ